jgi:hypothetical protein
MKIISKFKDYYDFVAGHDDDSVVTYERTTLKAIHQIGYDQLNDLTKRNHFVLNDFRFDYPFHLKSSSYMWNKKRKKYININEFGEFHRIYFCNKIYLFFITKSNQIITDLTEFKEFVNPNESNSFSYSTITNFNKDSLFDVFETDLNKKFNSPIIWINNDNEVVLNPKLSDLNFINYFSAIDCYQSIYNWLSENKPQVEIPSSPNDMYRYESKGFDKKTSFRNIK